MKDKQVSIEVDGKTLQATAGQMLIEVTDANDIYIPRFCYHKKLSVAANCRMCLVEVEKAPKPLPACATPVMEGMKVHTQSKKALEAQKGVMEFLLINHPLDCPICDQGGECELQDLAMGYGRDISRYHEKKRVVKDKNIGPLVQTDLTRCIHCTRCIRFGEEIAGLRELGATGRGEDMQIGTYIEKSMVSELSGNVIDICPVGALTSKPFRFSARTWEMIQRDGVAPHDSVGSNIHFHIKENRVKRVVPAENESINEVWLSDRDRFSYEGLYHEDRITTPMIKQAGEWQSVDWETALQFVVDGLNRVRESEGNNAIGALASPNSTLEELYLFQKLMRGMGTYNIDHRIHQRDFRQQKSSPLFPWLGQSIESLENPGAVLLVGSHVRKEQPLINHRLRKASMRGGSIAVLNQLDYEFNFNVTDKIIVAPDRIPKQLAGILKALSMHRQEQLEVPFGDLLAGIEVTEPQRRIAQLLHDAKQATILLGNAAQAHSEYSLIQALAYQIARRCSAHYGYLATGANSTGAALAGMLPHRQPAGHTCDQTGLDAYSMFEQKLGAYILLGVEPEMDCWDGQQAMHALQSAHFVTVMSAFGSGAIQHYADVILPIALYAETSGTYINCEGKAQSFNGVVAPPGEARPAWKVLRVLGNLFDQEDFTYTSSEEIKHEVLESIATLQPDNSLYIEFEGLPETTDAIQHAMDIPMNSVDPLVRRATALQQTVDCADGHCHINSRLAQKLGLEAGDTALLTQDTSIQTLPVRIDDRVPDQCVMVQTGQAITGPWQGMIDIRRSET